MQCGGGLGVVAAFAAGAYGAFEVSAKRWESLSDERDRSAEVPRDVDPGTFGSRAVRPVSSTEPDRRPQRGHDCLEFALGGLGPTEVVVGLSIVDVRA